MTPADIQRITRDWEAGALGAPEPANDRAPRLLNDPAVGGWKGIVVMVAVAVLAFGGWALAVML